jgi:ribonuclease R
MLAILQLDSKYRYGINKKGQVIFKSIPVFPQEHEYYLTPTHMHKKTRLNHLVCITIKEGNNAYISSNFGPVKTLSGWYTALLQNQRISKNPILKFGDWKPLLKLDRIEIKYPVYSIDPEACRDIDDTISLQEQDTHWEIGIHIADVGGYLIENGLVDSLNLHRFSTIYTPNKNYNMLDEAFATNILSLVKKQKRNTISTIIHIDKTTFELIDYKIVSTTIINRNNLTYEKANKSPFYKKFMNIISRFYTNYSGRSVEITDSHELIEKLMIFANHFTCSKLISNGSNPIVRVFSQNEDINKIKDRELKSFVSIYNSNSRAQYEFYDKNKIQSHSCMKIGVYGHTTSPIRRISDIYNQLLLYSTILPKLDLDEVNDYELRLKTFYRQLHRIELVQFIDKQEITEEMGTIIGIENDKFVVWFRRLSHVAHILFVPRKVEILYDIFANDDYVVIKDSEREIKIELYKEYKFHFYLNRKTDNILKKLRVQISNLNNEIIFE